jgi:hypothetical protein
MDPDVSALVEDWLFDFEPLPTVAQDELYDLAAQMGVSYDTLLQLLRVARNQQ